MPLHEAEPHNPVKIDEQLCIRCNLCDWICPGDLIYKEEDNKQTLPVVVYPRECWYCGMCEAICPTNAIEIIFPDIMLHNETDVVDLLGKVVT
ncbi:MAG: ferredoxin family protein [Rhodobiaceae bacterium]|nr:ferredoxin family protein [Rhodobiaceae bacterium]